MCRLDWEEVKVSGAIDGSNFLPLSLSLSLYLSLPVPLYQYHYLSLYFYLCRSQYAWHGYAFCNLFHSFHLQPDVPDKRKWNFAYSNIEYIYFFCVCAEWLAIVLMKRAANFGQFQFDLHTMRSSVEMWLQTGELFRICCLTINNNKNNIKSYQQASTVPVCSLSLFN